MHLSDEDFLNLIKNGILPAIDLIVRNERNEVLIGKRKNEPARGFWFVPGGRIRKNESFSDAIHRICKAEIGKLNPDFAYKFLGIFNHIYKDNFFEDPGFGTHYMTLGIELNLDDIKTDNHTDHQHDETRFLSIAELLETENVHENTKYYFTEVAPNRFV